MGSLIFAYWFVFKYGSDFIQSTGSWLFGKYHII